MWDYLVVPREALEDIYCIINDQIISSSKLIKIMLKNGNNDLQLAKLVLRLYPITLAIYHDLLTINAPNRQGHIQRVNIGDNLFPLACAAGL